MGKNSDHKLEIERVFTLPDLEAFLLDLARQVREESRIVLQEAGRSLTLPLDSEVFLELKAKCKKGKSKLELEIVSVTSVPDPQQEDCGCPDEDCTCGEEGDETKGDGEMEGEGNPANPDGETEPSFD